MRMGVEVNGDNRNTRGWLIDKNNRRRRLDVFYTDYNTKLFVEDGTLIEEKIKRSSTTQTHLSDSDKEQQYARLSEYYLCTSPPESPRPTMEEMDHSQTIEAAKVALEYYNKKHHTHYELTKPVLSNGSLWNGGLWIHANFTAFDSSNGDSDAKLFFAELKVSRKFGVRKDVVTACRPFNGSKRTTSCEMCEGGDIVHPTSRFRQGLYETKPRDLRPRRNGRAV
ncbi:hypothetical protein RND81_14G104700 [Saponaria officinalis]|uniref:DUF3615 domain-containing protein n=1 Tax=Saponaria officinalis TaxID=3572 RepID=A0AAW1GNL0_SAPOF